MSEGIVTQDYRKDLERIANSYLEHTLVALRARDYGANFRDFLDPWWIYERGGDFLKTIRSKGNQPTRYSAHTFNNPCPWVHRNRLSQFDKSSQGARDIIAKGQAARIKNRNTHPIEHRLIVDHAVPFKELKEALWKKSNQWDRDSLRVYLKANFKRVVLSATENAQLDTAGLKAAMPDDWNGIDPYARYRKVGIDLHSKSTEG